MLQLLDVWLNVNYWVSSYIRRDDKSSLIALIGKWAMDQKIFFYHNYCFFFPLYNFSFYLLFFQSDHLQSQNVHSWINKKSRGWKTTTQALRERCSRGQHLKSIIEYIEMKVFCSCVFLWLGRLLLMFLLHKIERLYQQYLCAREGVNTGMFFWTRTVKPISWWKSGIIVEFLTFSIIAQRESCVRSKLVDK